MMRADEISHAFNGVLERKYWQASIAGTRVNPEVHFNSRASMVRIAYRIAHDDFTVTFSKTAAAFGDYLASAYRSMAEVLTCLKAAGLPFRAPLDGTPVLRIQYGSHDKNAVIHMADLADAWLEAEPYEMDFKDTQKLFDETSEIPLDPESTDI
jgi:hypothetical protein